MKYPPSAYTWTDEVAVQALPAGPFERDRCTKRHRTKAAAYTCGARRLRSVAHVDRYHGPMCPFSSVRLEVWAL